MKISTQSRYGLRALFDIAYYGAGSSIQVKDISARQGISPRYIEQIFQKLKRAGIVKSVRGPSGGYYLAKMPADISVGDIVRATEGNVQLVHCGDPGNRSSKQVCERADRCVVRDMWKEASGRMISYLDSVTLQDICNDAREKGIERLSP